jgi:hypothetical protein
MQTIITLLLIACAIAFLYFWRKVAKQSCFYEIATLASKSRIEMLQLAERKRQFNLVFEFLFFKIIGPILMSGVSASIESLFGVYYGIVGGRIPKQLYEGDSAQIVLTFPWEKPFKSDEVQFRSITYLMRENDSAYPSLEIELQAAGFHISGEQTQNYALHSLPAVYAWNISAEKSGNFEIGIIIRLYSRANYPPVSVVSTHRIRVAKIAFLTSRQLWIITGIFGIFTAMLGVIQALVSLKIIIIP